MSKNRDNRWPVGLVLLLVFQWLLVVVSLYFVHKFAVLFIAFHEYGFILYILALACWAIAMSSASVQVTRRRPGGFLVGMICHLLLGILSLVGLIGFGSMGILSFVGEANDANAWAPMYLLFALMWLPFVLISGWGFFYLRRLRKRLSPL